MIRRATAEDAPQLMQLMRLLAAFEGYADRFAVTQEDLVERGFSAHRPAEFIAWVIEGQAGILTGYVAVYVIPFTFDLRPTIVIKELFVEESQRGRQHGHELFAAVSQYAQSLNGRLLRWQVLPSNEIAKHFYRQRGGVPDVEWENWILDLERL